MNESDPKSEAIEALWDSPTHISDGPAIELERIRAVFGGVVALNNVDLQIGSTETVAIIGPNGAGKSTLLNVMSGLSPLTSGHYRLGGRTTDGATAVALARRGIGRSFQEPRLLDEHSVLENVMCGAYPTLEYAIWEQVLRPLKVRRAEARVRARAHAAMALVGLSDVASIRAGALSYGMRKRLDIARALVNTRTVLLLDEPTSGLDRDERAGMAELLSELKSLRRLAVVVVEHHMDVVESVADVAVELQAGEVSLRGTPSHVISNSGVAS